MKTKFTFIIILLYTFSMTFAQEKIVGITTKVVTPTGELGDPHKSPDTQEGEQDETTLGCPDGNHPHAIDLGLPSGTKWACCNVGATKPTDHGGYYAWGETEEKDFYSFIYYSHCNGQGQGSHGFYHIGWDICKTPYDVAYVKWGGNWQMPTKDQILELERNTTYQNVVLNDIAGGLFEANNGNTIFLPFSGKYVISQIENRDDFGLYWSSIYDFDSDSYCLDVYPQNFRNYTSELCCYGLPVRPVITNDIPDSLTLSATDLDISCGKADSIYITSGGGDYAINCSSDIVDAVIKGNKVIVDTYHTGSAVITISDVYNNLEQTLNVHVSEELVFPFCPDNHHPHIIDLGLPSGTKWACCNIGAADPLEHGDYYAWGETEIKGEYSIDNYTYCNGKEGWDLECDDIGDNICGTQYDVAYMKWGGGWQMPTREQIKELITTCSYTYITSNPIYHGFIIGTDNYGYVTGPNGNSIAFPISISGYCAGVFLYKYESSYTWSGTIDIEDDKYAYVSNCFMGNFRDWSYARWNGMPVRPVMNETNSIVNISVQNKSQTNGVINIYGIKMANGIDNVNNLPSGIYIQNGKKFIVK